MCSSKLFQNIVLKIYVMKIVINYIMVFKHLDRYKMLLRIRWYYILFYLKHILFIVRGRFYNLEMKQ